MQDGNQLAKEVLHCDQVPLVECFVQSRICSILRAWI
jgi:hypothetical protein